jgi:hypothetical protein
MNAVLCKGSEERQSGQPVLRPELGSDDSKTEVMPLQWLGRDWKVLILDTFHCFSFLQSELALDISKIEDTVLWVNIQSCHTVYVYILSRRKQVHENFR